MLYSSEHGANTDDEVNIIEKAHNYGWPYVRGICDEPWETKFCTDSPLTAPTRYWTPAIAPCGIDYYNHPMFPTLQHSLLLTTLKDKHLYQLSLNETGDSIISTNIIAGVNIGRLRDICISPEGKIFLSTSNSYHGDTGKRMDKIVVLEHPLSPMYQNNLLLYPVPAVNVLHFSLPGSPTGVQCAVWSGVGQLVATMHLSATSHEIDISGLNAGVYHLILLADTGAEYQGNFVKVN
jgi:hypothetical protein